MEIYFRAVPATESHKNLVYVLCFSAFVAKGNTLLKIGKKGRREERKISGSIVEIGRFALWILVL
jgi:hypothetical protein